MAELGKGLFKDRQQLMEFISLGNHPRSIPRICSSVLVPELFILPRNDIIRVLRVLKSILFADDV